MEITPLSTTDTELPTMEGNDRIYCELCNQMVENWGPWCALYTLHGRILCPPLLWLLVNAMHRVADDQANTPNPPSNR